LLTSHQIFRYAVPARTVTKKALLCPNSIWNKWSDVTADELKAYYGDDTMVGGVFISHNLLKHLILSGIQVVVGTQP